MTNGLAARQSERVDWTGAIGSTIAGLVLGGLIRVVIVVRYRRRLRADPFLAERAVSVRVDSSRSHQGGVWVASGAIAFAGLLTLLTNDSHPVEFFWLF